MMSRSNLNGLIVFLAIIATIILWMPFTGSAERNFENGEVHTATRFGVFGYFYVYAELDEPNYKLMKQWEPRGLVPSIVITGALWTLVVWRVRRGKSRGDRPDGE